MADGKDEPANIIAPGATPAADSAAKPETKSEPAKIEMATVESPPIAPVIETVKPEPVIEPAAAAKADAPARFPFAMPNVSMPPLRMPPLSRRMKQRGILAATIAMAAGIGAAVGATAIASRTPSQPTIASLQERDAMQTTIAKLGKEISTLKANLDSANKNATSQIAKINDKLSEQTRRASTAPETTGSIQPAAPAQIPVPAPRPAVAAIEPPPSVIPGWYVRDARNGTVLVEGRGELFEVVPGAPLPGLGRVESIRRQDGRWVVTTPKGIIVSSAPVRPRGYGYYDRY